MIYRGSQSSINCERAIDLPSVIDSRRVFDNHGERSALLGCRGLPLPRPRRVRSSYSPAPTLRSSRSSSALPLPPKPHALAQDSAPRKQLALRRRPASRWHCRGCGVWLRLGSLTRVRRRHESCGVGSCIALPSLCSCRDILSPDARSTRLFVASV